jgi:hypothetical protein
MFQAEVVEKCQKHALCSINNTILKNVGSEAKGSNPTTGLTLLLARNPFRGNFNHWQVSQKEAEQKHYSQTG